MLFLVLTNDRKLWYNIQHLAPLGGITRKPMELLDWQKPLAAKQTEVLEKERCFLMAAHTGAGKTYLAAETIKALKLPTIVVAPKISLTQWSKVLEGMGAMPYIKAIINPEKLVVSKKQRLYDNDLGWQTDARLLIFDEVHRGASGERSKTTKALARWCNKMHPDNKVLAMSATPFESPMKMRAVGYLMGFHRFIDSSWYEFLKSNGCFMSSRGGRNHIEFTKDKRRSAVIMRNLRSRMGERFLAVTPDEIPNFPSELKEIELIDLDQKDHDALVQAYADMPDTMKSLSEDERVRLLRMRQQAEFCKAGVIAEMAKRLAEDGYSVFVCLNFTDARMRVQTYLTQYGVPFASIYGGQPERERQKGIDDFQANRVHIMVGMAPACSVALSLHDEHHERPRVSLISPGYSASEFAQALGRIRRVGGTAATQKIIIAAGSVEERVGQAIERKMNNLAALCDADFERG